MQLEIQNHLIHNITVFTEKLHHLASKRKFNIENLGKVEDDSILLLLPERVVKGPKLLVAAGFHGDEPAGCWGILQFLEENYLRFSRNFNISFLPLVNPSGFRHGSRINEWQENPNGNFCHTTSGKPEPSREGRILLDHLDQLKFLATDGFVSLHEDFEQNRFYLYTFEQTENPGKFSQALYAELRRFFEPVPDGIVEGVKVVDGIVFHNCDGSFEDFLFHEGIPRTACTETPGLLDIKKRIEANSSIIAGLINLTIGS